MSIEKPDDMSDWFFIIVVIYCSIKAVFQTSWLVLRHPLSWREEAKKRGILI